MLTFSSISSSVGRESEGTRAGEAPRRYGDRRERGWLRVPGVGHIAVSGSVRVGEGFIVSIMAWLDDNGCPREKSETRRGFHFSLLPWAGVTPAPSDSWSCSATAPLSLDRAGTRIGGTRRAAFSFSARCGVESWILCRCSGNFGLCGQSFSGSRGSPAEAGATSGSEDHGGD
jgi:hypothetical protein